jgi:hypothetical protein
MKPRKPDAIRYVVLKVENCSDRRMGFGSLIVGASLLANSTDIFASKLAPTMGCLPNGQSEFEYLPPTVYVSMPLTRK